MAELRTEHLQFPEQLVDVQTVDEDQFWKQWKRLTRFHRIFQRSHAIVRMKQYVVFSSGEFRPILNRGAGPCLIIYLLVGDQSGLTKISSGHFSSAPLQMLPFVDSFQLSEIEDRAIDSHVLDQKKQKLLIPDVVDHALLGDKRREVNPSRELFLSMLDEVLGVSESPSIEVHLFGNNLSQAAILWDQERGSTTNQLNSILWQQAIIDDLLGAGVSQRQIFDHRKKGTIGVDSTIFDPKRRVISHLRKGVDETTS